MKVLRMYQCAWRLVWAVIVFSGASVSTTVLPAPALIVLVLLGSAAGLLTLTLNGRRSNTDRAQPLDTLLSAAASRAARGACCLLAVVGLSAFIGSFTMLLATLSVITSPWFLSSLTGTSAITSREPAVRGEKTETSRIADAAMDPLNSIQTLSYEGLCRMWRSTYLPVKVADDPGSLEELSTLRRACLDELERRDPTAFHAWLDSRPLATGTPKKFVK